MEMIKLENNVAVLQPETLEKIIKFETALKRLKEQEDELKKAILEEMESKSIIKIDHEELAISYVAATDREYFNAKKLRKDNPELYDEYVEMRAVKPSIRFKVK